MWCFQVQFSLTLLQSGIRGVCEPLPLPQGGNTCPTPTPASDICGSLSCCPYSQPPFVLPPGSHSCTYTCRGARMHTHVHTHTRTPPHTETHTYTHACCACTPLALCRCRPLPATSSLPTPSAGAPGGWGAASDWRAAEAGRCGWKQSWGPFGGFPHVVRALGRQPRQAGPGSGCRRLQGSLLPCWAPITPPPCFSLAVL